jgi:hypothetical protein
LIPTEEFGVVVKIAKKPIELPERTFRTVEAPREGKCFMRDRLQDAEAEGKEGLLRMPPIGSPFDTDEKQSIEITDEILMSGMQSGNVLSHGFASTG